jgi:hypothetical protein
MILVGEFENQDKAEAAYDINPKFNYLQSDLKGIMSPLVVPLELPKPLRMLDITGK